MDADRALLSLGIGAPLLLALLYAIGVQGPLRVGCALAVVLVAAGASWTSLLPVTDRLAQLVCCVVVSLAVDLVVSAPLFYLRMWHPGSALAFVCGVSTVPVVLVTGWRRGVVT